MSYLDAVAPTQVGWLVDDYNWGESQVLQLVKSFDQFGRPKEFENRVEMLYASYESTKSVWLVRGIMNAGLMKDLGSQAQSLLKEIYAFMAAKAQRDGTPAPQGLILSKPPGGDGVLDAWSKFLQWAPWVVGGVAVVGAVGYIVVPIVAPLALASLKRRLGGTQAA